MPDLSEADLPNVDLTPREEDIVEGAAEGLTAREIAERHGLTTGTVRTYVARIARKIPGPQRQMKKLILYGNGVDPRSAGP